MCRGMGSSMQNGKVITTIRIVASTLISLTALIAAAVLLYHGIVVPAPWWLIATLAVGGVTGAEVISALVQKRGGEVQDGN